jgi:uncharacterized protein (DUF305 family)
MMRIFEGSAKERELTTKAMGMGVLILTAITFLSCSPSSRHQHVKAPGIAYDEAFLKWFIKYHSNNDRMLSPCAKSDTIRIELRNFCIETDRQHQERVERVRAWLKTWYNEELPNTDTLPLWLGTLKGPEFEREFLREYLRNHDEGVEETVRCIAQAVHPELRDLCSRINPNQKKTAEQLKRWQCEWFNECS